MPVVSTQADLPVRRIVIANRKGGCGKTTTAINLAHALVLRGRQVLLMDADPQAHATLSLGISPDDPRPAMYHLLTGKAAMAEIILPVLEEGLYLLPACRDLIHLEMDAAPVAGHQTRMAEMTETFPMALDYVIIDPPPSTGNLMINALVAATDVLIPMPLHFLAMEGLAEMMRLIYTVNATWNADLRLLGIVPTFLNPQTRIAREITTEIAQNFGTDKLFAGIRQNINLAEAPGYGKSVLAHAPRSIGAEDYRVLAAAIDM